VGDYILPNGNNNGIGKAIAPSKIKSSDLKNIVGIAWSESSNETGINTINVAVGLAVNDNQILVDEMKTEINNLQNQIAQTNAMLEKLVPGFKAPNSTTNTSNTSSDPLIKINQPTNDVAAEIKALGGVVNADGSIYYKPTIAQLEAGFELAEKMSIEDGSYSDNKETWTKIKNDPTFKQMIIDKITKELDQIRTLGIEEYKKSKKR
jgi:septation ring formation regulator EzrA